MATDSTCRCLSHSAMRINSGVVAPKSAISRPLPSAVGAHTQCAVLPRSIPAIFRLINGRPCSCLLLLAELLFFRSSGICFPSERSAQVGYGGFCPRGELREPHQCSIACLGPC